MRRRRVYIILGMLAGLLPALFPPQPAYGRPGFVQPHAGGDAFVKPLTDIPNSSLELHKINRLGLTVTNMGFFGTGYYQTQPYDPETGRRILACEFPLYSNVEYLYVGALWLGAVVGHDTLVTTGAEGYYDIIEFWPDAGEKGAMTRSSNLPFSRVYSADAKSEEDITAVYYDTLTNSQFAHADPIDNRPHQPLNVMVTQRSYAWSYAYAEDFVLIDYEIKNIGAFPLKKLYMGIMVDADAYHISKTDAQTSWLDDICGFKRVIPSPFWPGYEDTINIAWVADNDGDPQNGAFDYTACTGAAGTRVIRTPAKSLEYSFNWWVTLYNSVVDWGPRQVTDDKPYRDFGSNFGAPLGDRNKYYMLSTREFDYDQLECAVSHTGEGWLSPAKDAENYADGHNSIYLLSFGPFDVAPGQTLPVTIAYVGGDNFHKNPNDFKNYFTPLNPKPYQNRLDYTDLGLNSIWADWIYDNPGYDTNGDGDSGQARWFYNTTHTDSTYAFYKGDGVPDFRGAAPPPSPQLRIIPGYGKLTVRWNGQVTENSIDVFSGAKDFEGYKVYVGEGNRFADFVFMASYDIRDYNRYEWDDRLKTWQVSSTPITYDSLQKIYGADFDPDQYTESHPLNPNDSHNSRGIYAYFTPQYWNQSDLKNPLGIHKLYPDAKPDDRADTTEDGYLRYYEYEYVIDNLLPSQELYVSVTAFDFGSRTYQLSELESSRLNNATKAYPLTSVDEVEARGLKVTVYPNPYRIDGGYARAGFENRDRTKSAERTRAIHFANLPHVCTIRIFTPTGDMVQQIEHNRPDSGPDAQEETWNLISRNTQAVTTGIYLWSVRSAMGDQLGKLVIIK